MNSAAKMRQLAAGARTRASWRTARRQRGHDAGEDDQRDAVADAALGDLLAEPHDEGGAGGERDHRHDAGSPSPGSNTTLAPPGASIVSSPTAMKKPWTSASTTVP